MPRKGTLFDNLIGPRQHTGRKLDSQLLRRLQIDDEFKMGGLFNRQIPGTRAFDNPGHIVPDAFEKQDSVRALRHQPAIGRKLAVRRYSGKPVRRQ